VGRRKRVHLRGRKETIGFPKKKKSAVRKKRLQSPIHRREGGWKKKEVGRMKGLKRPEPYEEKNEKEGGTIRILI